MKIPLLILPFIGEEETSSSNVLLYFHGNGEDVGHTRYFLEIFQSELNMNIIAMEYAGYGTYKDTTVSTDQIKLDSMRVYDYIVKELGIPEKNVLIFGRSFGTGPACFLASERKPGGLVLMSGFLTIKLLLENLGEKVDSTDYVERFNNSQLLEKLASPCLLIHGKKDDRINIYQTQELESGLKFTGKNVKAVYPDNMTNNSFDVVEDITNNIKLFLKENEFPIDSIKITQNPFMKQKKKILSPEQKEKQ